MMSSTTYLSGPAAKTHGKADTAIPDGDEGLLRQMKMWYRADQDHSKTWRAEAKEDFDFRAGEQWSEVDKAKLKHLMRPVITFNRILPILNSVSGHEIGNRQEVRYFPREAGDAKPNELLTEAGRWFRDLSDADDEDSEAFLDAATCGMGWTDTTLNYEEEEAGDPDMDVVSPIEMYWDCGARKKNLDDAERRTRVRQLPLAKARRLFPDADITELDAAWAKTEGDDGEIEDQDREDQYEGDDTAEVADDSKLVTIVHTQYKARVDAYVVVDPMTGEKQELSPEEYKVLKKRYDEIGFPVASTRKVKTVVKDCFMGATVLRHQEALCPDKFRYQCITAYQDKNKGTWFGLVRPMKDPQRWANKWMSQALDILNSTAKGGIMAEQDAVDNPREFEKNWARTDKVAWFKKDALAKNKIKEKPNSQFPAGFYQLMEYAVSSVRDVTGVSVEMLGMREADQPASLEYQRRQAGMTILQPLFSSLKRYRREHGKVMLYLIQNYLSDGRLVRILGEEGAQYVPLLKQSDLKYDIVVDDMPNSPNQKEMTWAFVKELFPTLPPQIQLALVDTMPLPETVVQKIKEAAASIGEDPTAEQAKQLAMALEEAKVTLTQAQAVKARADAEESTADAALKTSQIGMPVGRDGIPDKGPDRMLDVARIRADVMKHREKMANDTQIAREKNASDQVKARLDAQAKMGSAALSELAKTKADPYGMSY